MNNKKAEINIGDKQPILLSTTNVLPGQAATGAVPTTSTVTSIEFRDTGVKLTVEPSIRLGNELSLKMKVEVIRVGDQIKPFGTKVYRIAGIYSPESGPRTKLTLAGLQEALESTNKCTFIFVKLRNPDQVDAMAAKINTELPGNTIQPTKEIFAGFEKTIPFLGVFLRVLVGLAAVVSALVVMLAMYTTITERTREIGILKAMGASRGYIVGIIEKEAILISVIGLIAGFATSAIAGLLIHKVYGLVFEYSWQWALTAASIGLIGGVLGALYPAVRASNLDAVSALAYD